MKAGILMGARKNMIKLLSMTVMMLATTTVMQAQDEPKLVVKPSGRILFDAAYVNSQQAADKLNSGVAIPDMRASYTKVSNRSGFEDNHATILETRLQIKF